MINLLKLKHATSLLLLLFMFILLAAMLSSVSSDISKDQAECQQQLITLSSCINYVTGEAKAPSSQCCMILYKQLNVTKKCLCIIVKDRNETSFGLKLNATLALSLPSLCHAVNNPMDCLGLLHLDPKSPEAQIFIQSANSTTQANDSRSSPMTNGGEPQIWHKMRTNNKYNALLVIWRFFWVFVLLHL